MCLVLMMWSGKCGSDCRVAKVFSGVWQVNGCSSHCDESDRLTFWIRAECARKPLRNALAQLVILGSSRKLSISRNAVLGSG